MNKGFTLIETLIAIGLFTIISASLYSAYSNVIDIFSASYLNLTALSAMDNEVEIIRNMPYISVGTQGGSPSGIIPAEKNIVFGNINFVVNTFVRNVDDPFDGIQGGTPNDLAPADYKLVEIEISCSICSRFIPAKMTTLISPPGQETVTNGGTLVIKVFNASGQPISGANVTVVNTAVNPVVNLNDTTDSSGILKLVDVATSSAGYAITVSKNGYSTDRTYLPGGVSNPNPLKPNATVLSQEITETSFVIDRVSTLSMRTQNEFCSGVGSIDFLQSGQKLIGTNPNVLKYSLSHATDINGNTTVNNLEFDAYHFQSQDTGYEVSGFTPLTPVAVDPNGTYALTWLMSPKGPSAIVVTVKDQDGQLVNDANVTISKTGFSSSEYTGRKFLLDTDWSNSQYDSKSSSVEEADPSGGLHLKLTGGKYASSSDEWLVSKTIDFGTSNTAFYNLLWNPSGQPPQTGSDSLRIQIASNNDNSSWNFIGPDGTVNSYYSVSDSLIYSGHNSNRYLRYKVYLKTQDEDYTPSLQDLTLYFNSSCIPDGQAYFSGLVQGTHTITVQKTGYNNFTDTGIIVDSDWEDYKLILTN